MKSQIFTIQNDDDTVATKIQAIEFPAGATLSDMDNTFKAVAPCQDWDDAGPEAIEGLDHLYTVAGAKVYGRM